MNNFILVLLILSLPLLAVLLLLFYGHWILALVLLVWGYWPVSRG